MMFNEHHTACVSFLWSRSVLETLGWYSEHYGGSDKNAWIHIATHPRYGYVRGYVFCEYELSYDTNYGHTSKYDPYIVRALLKPILEFTYSWWYYLHRGEL
ncbi:hypothetical protein HC928_06245 [bacterium]|nr:hypothetical protein [bacterium]